jgi:hypothetical protein
MPLTFHLTAGRSAALQQYSPEYQVMQSSLPVGHINRQADSTPLEWRWYWTIDGVRLGPILMQFAGSSPTYEQAKEEITQNWDRWLTWAKLQEIPQ